MLWHKATSAHINNYRQHLEPILLDILNSFMLRMSDCTDCNRNDHTRLIDTAATRLQNALVDCSYEFQCSHR